MRYQIQEGSFPLEGQWQDSSANILMAEGLPIEGVNLVIMRHRLGEDQDFDAFVATQRSYLTGLNAREILIDRPGTIDTRRAHFFEVTWADGDKTLHQMVLLVLHDGNRILNMSSTIPGGPKEAIRTSLLDSMARFTFTQPAS